MHPNCSHRIVAFIWSQKTQEEQAAALKAAQKPFNVDPRGEEERKRYEEIQRKNRERLRDRKQWEKYRAVLGNKNVPNFSRFRAMKRSKNEHWNEMSADYHEVLKILKKEDIIIEKFNASLPLIGKPNGVKDLIKEDGTVKQRRIYNSNGKPLKDLDMTNHGNPKRHPVVPHAHDWVDGERNNKGRPWTEQEKWQNRDLLGDDENF